MDSLQAMRFRRLILASLRNQSDPDHTYDKVLRSPDVVYKYPSISKLAAFLSSRPSEVTRSDENAMIELYTERYAIQTTQYEKRKHVVLLTGSTGSLGSYLLCQFVATDAVGEVICLNRESELDPYKTPSTEKGLMLAQTNGRRLRFTTRTSPHLILDCKRRSSSVLRSASQA